MASGQNTKTGEYIPGGLNKNKTYKDIILNPTQEIRDQYKIIPAPPTEAEIALIELNSSDNGMIRCIDDIIAYIENDTPLPQVTKDKATARDLLRAKLK